MQSVTEGLPTLETASVSRWALNTQQTQATAAAPATQGTYIIETAYLS